MNIILAIIYGLKRAPECVKMHHFEGEHATIFLGRGHSPSQTPPHWGGGFWGEGYPFPNLTLHIRVPSAVDPLDMGLLIYHQGTTRQRHATLAVK